MFFDEVYNLLFTEWFQRKTLKSTPIGFAAEFEHPESCVYLTLGCYWAVDRGLVRNVVGEPGTPQDRRSSFVFLDLHDIQDESVANQLSKQIQSLVPTQLKSFMSVKVSVTEQFPCSCGIPLSLMKSALHLVDGLAQ